MLVGEPRRSGGDVVRSASRAGDRWREARRYVLATLLLLALYAAIGEARERLVHRLMIHGWIPGDSTEQYAEQVAEIASTSRARDAELGPTRARAAFDLGVQYGYVSQSRVSRAALPPSVRAHEEADLADALRQLNASALALGLTDALPLATGSSVDDLYERIDADAAGAAARVEAVTSPRLRHVFLLGAMAGTVQARLDPRDELLPAPIVPIGRHATLAGVPEPLWRPLTRVDQGDRAQVLASHRSAVDAIGRYLATAP